MNSKNNLKKIKEISLNLFIGILSYFVPKKKNTLLFGSGYGKSFSRNPKYLFNYLIRNQKKYLKIKFYWLTENKKIYKELKNKNHPVLYKYSLKGIIQILTSEFIIIEDTVKDFSFFGKIIGNFNIIQTWHGTPLKKIGFDSFKNTNLIEKISNKVSKQECQKYIFICSTSKKINTTLKTAFQNNNTIITGYPRNDIFFNKKLEVENLQKKLKLKKYKKIISYIPTFRDKKTNKIPFTKKGLIQLNNYLKNKNCLLILKKHPIDKNFPNLKKYSNIKDFSKKIDDVQELLIHTDLLITDYSSVFFDYCLTNNPIIYYPYDYEEYLIKCRGMYYDYYKELPGPFAKNEEELFNLIKNFNKWSKEKNYKEKYIKFKKEFNHYQDGASCQRVLEEIQKIKK